LGNEAYKKKDFAKAHEHYDKAIELDPNNIVFYNNKAGLFFILGYFLVSLAMVSVRSRCRI